MEVEQQCAILNRCDGGLFGDTGVCSYIANCTRISARVRTRAAEAPERRPLTDRKACG